MEPENEHISIMRQCELLGLVRSMWYYQPNPEDPEDLRLMILMDEKYLKTPFYGLLKMREWLKREHAREHSEAFEELVRTLRKTEEWQFVDREIVIRLMRDSKE